MEIFVRRLASDNYCHSVFLQEEEQWAWTILISATKVINGHDQVFESAGLDRRQWTNSSPIRAIYKIAFTVAGLPYFHPHSFRKTFVKIWARSLH
jgi:integrase